MTRFDFTPTALAGLLVVQRKAMADSRGSLSRLYCLEAFSHAGLTKPIAQINHTRAHLAGAVRGLHFQHPPYTETKFVSCLKGEIWDVAVDLRVGSPTFLDWHGEVLSAANRRSLLIPEGFAHGYQTLVEDCELLYLHTTPYHPEAEGALHVADPRLGIEWPLPIQDLSERDANHPFIVQGYSGINL